jgi:hypothetical protein
VSIHAGKTHHEDGVERGREQQERPDDVARPDEPRRQNPQMPADRGTPVLTVVTNNEDAPAGRVDGGSLIDEIVREGARRVLAAALEAEVAAYVAGHVDQLDERGRRLVVRNGHAEERQLLTSAGAVTVRAPRVNDKRVDEATGERQRFASAILPAWCRKSPKITEALPAAVPARLVQQGLRPRAGGIPRHRRGPVRGHDHEADHAVAGRGPSVQ